MKDLIDTRLASVHAELGTSGHLEVVGLGLDDGRPYLAGFQTSSGAWTSGLLMPTSATAALLSMTRGPSGRTEVVGLDRATGTPFIATFQTNDGSWQGSWYPPETLSQKLRSIAVLRDDNGVVSALGVTVGGWLVNALTLKDGSWHKGTGTIRSYIAFPNAPQPLGGFIGDEIGNAPCEDICNSTTGCIGYYVTDQGMTKSSTAKLTAQSRRDSNNALSAVTQIQQRRGQALRSERGRDRSLVMLGPGDAAQHGELVRRDRRREARRRGGYASPATVRRRGSQTIDVEERRRFPFRAWLSTPFLCSAPSPNRRAAASQ